jgi:hypothetical protein
MVGFMSRSYAPINTICVLVFSANSSELAILRDYTPRPQLLIYIIIPRII